LSPSSIHPPVSSASFSSYDNHDDDRPSSPALPSDIDPTSTNTTQTFRDDRPGNKKKQSPRANGTRPPVKRMSLAMFTNKLQMSPARQLRKLSKVNKWVDRINISRALHLFVQSPVIVHIFRPFKVVLFMINCNLSSVSHRFRDIALRSPKQNKNRTLQCKLEPLGQANRFEFARQNWYTFCHNTFSSRTDDRRHIMATAELCNAIAT